MDQSASDIYFTAEQEVLPCSIHVDIFYNLSRSRELYEEEPVNKPFTDCSPSTMLTKFETKSARVKGK